MATTDERENAALPSALPVAAPTLNPTIGTLAALGVTLDETTICVLENVSGYYRLIGWSRKQRDAGAALTQDTAVLCRDIGRRLDRVLWDEETQSPFLLSPDPILYPPLEHFSVGVSPRPRMRVQLLGLSQEGLRATRQALASAPLHLTGMIQLHPNLTSGKLAAKLLEDRPEAMIIVGGYDNPDPTTHSWLYTLCRLAGQALSRLSPSERPVVYYAGNRWAREGAEALLQPQEGPLIIQPINNVLPYPGHIVRTELPVVLSQLYWQLCQRMPGFAQLSRWATAPGHVANLEATFARLIQIWMEYHGLPRLHGLYCTPHWWLHVWAEATTKGIQMRFVKPNSRPQEFTKWPPLQLVCGPWPRQLWSPPQRAWWDQHALAPLITTIGQVAPQAMVQALEEDVLESRHSYTRQSQTRHNHRRGNR